MVLGSVRKVDFRVRHFGAIVDFERLDIKTPRTLPGERGSGGGGAVGAGGGGAPPPPPPRWIMASSRDRSAHSDSTVLRR